MNKKLYKTLKRNVVDPNPQKRLFLLLKNLLRKEVTTDLQKAKVDEGKTPGQKAAARAERNSRLAGVKPGHKFAPGEQRDIEQGHATGRPGVKVGNDQDYQQGVHHYANRGVMKVKQREGKAAVQRMHNAIMRQSRSIKPNLPKSEVKKSQAPEEEPALKKAHDPFHVVKGPHLMLTVDHPVTGMSKMSHDDAKKILQGAGEGLVTDMHQGIYGDPTKPEHTIIVSNPSPRQVAAAHKVAKLAGQEAFIHSEGFGKHHVMHFVNGPQAGQTVQGHGSEEVSDQDPMRTKLSSGKAFRHKF